MNQCHSVPCFAFLVPSVLCVIGELSSTLSVHPGGHPGLVERFLHILEDKETVSGYSSLLHVAP